ncbi:hypothetical protein QOZ80_2BG0162600 [Eleusine coracana subsp. coracana]|nr:hypothetical protein QOZ80_2BG0162600 [Eleusine coracana subsp. coracana]
MCYYARDKASTYSVESVKDKQIISRELSNYIVYLIFKCGVFLTSNSQIMHERARCEIRALLHKKSEEEFFEATKQNQDSSVIEVHRDEELADKEDDSMVTEVQLNKEQADNNNPAGSYVQELLQTAQDLESPVLPRAYQVAQALISINNESHRWGLIAKVWSEMLYYTAPRCGGSFHYEHLSTGGEFITHVFLLMYFLGPFLPHPGT